jgi:hypothetical protein
MCDSPQTFVEKPAITRPVSRLLEVYNNTSHLAISIYGLVARVIQAQARVKLNDRAWSNSGLVGSFSL